MSEEETIAEWFKDHRAYYACLEDAHAGQVQLLSWRKSRTSIYRIDYSRCGAVLCVYGDVGSAVYRWQEIATLEWIARCDLAYFAGKCEASEEGKGYREWSEGKATAWLRERCKESREYPDFGDLAAWGVTYALETCAGWCEWLGAHGAALGGDHSEMGNIGMKVALRCRAQLQGLKLAMAQVAEQEGADT